MSGCLTGVHAIGLSLTPVRDNSLPEAAPQGWASMSFHRVWLVNNCWVTSNPESDRTGTHILSMPLWLAGIALPHVPCSGTQPHRHDLVTAKAKAQVSKSNCTRLQASTFISPVPSGQCTLGRPKGQGPRRVLNPCEQWQRCGWMSLPWASEESGPVTQSTPVPCADKTNSQTCPHASPVSELHTHILRCT